MSDSVDISHLVFLDLLQSLVETTGPRVAKGNLMRIAMNVGRRVREVDYASFAELVEAAGKGDTPLARLEGVSTHLGAGLFGVKHCPFAGLLTDYAEFFQRQPEGLQELAAAFNCDSKVNRELKVGQGAGAGVFCLFHQPMRATAGSNISIQGKPVRMYQLACKDSSGKVHYADPLIREFGCDRQLVVEAMTRYMCCYGIKTEES